MNYNNIEQYSAEWWALRKGRFTASMASKIITPTGKKSTQYRGEIGRLIAEQMGWQEPEMVTSEWMDRGSEMEDEARAWFSFEKNLDVMNGGIITVGDRLASSPDGLTGYMPNPIPCEFKVPKPSTHIKWLLAGELPPEHKPQMHFHLIATEAPHGWFMSYHPEMEPLLVKVERDDYTEALYSFLQDAVKELEEAYNRITGEVSGEV